jgi:hypothetical protein
VDDYRKRTQAFRSPNGSARTKRSYSLRPLTVAWLEESSALAGISVSAFLDSYLVEKAGLPAPIKEKESA